MRKFITVIFALCLVLTNKASFAMSTMEVEEYDNLPPPMTVTYGTPQPAATPEPIVVTIQPYQPGETSEPQTPPQEEQPEIIPAPTPTLPISNIAGNYKKGSVYGPNLSTKELKQVKAKVMEIVSACIRDGMTDSEKLVALTNYLCEHCSYAGDWSKNRANSAWGALVYGEAQCSGYARAMKALCDAAGVSCYYVHASKEAFNPSHQWNVVQVDGQWYHLDVQCIDSSYSGANKPIVLTGEYMPYSTKGIPKTAGSYLTLQ